MYIKVSFLSKSDLTNKQKKKYIDKLFPEEPKPYSPKERNQGFIHKFNNAIGFKNVVGYYDNWNCYVRPRVSSPVEYITPEKMLFNAVRPDFDGKYIMTFVLKNEYMCHPSKKYSYHTKDIVKKLEKFAIKVFPGIEVMTEYMENEEELSEKDFVLNNFILNISDDYNYTIEVSIANILPDKDIKDILRVLKTVVNRNISISQRYCEVCKDYSSGKTPYHVEIEYLD